MKPLKQIIAVRVGDAMMKEVHAYMKHRKFKEGRDQGRAFRELLELGLKAFKK